MASKVSRSILICCGETSFLSKGFYPIIPMLGNVRTPTKQTMPKRKKNARLRICLHFAPILPHGACRESFRACGDWKFRARQAYAKAHSNYFWQVFPALNSGLDVSWQREQESAAEFECGSWHTTQLNPLWSPVGVRSSQERAWRSQLGE